MNIALTTVLIFIFLLPGLIFRRFYYTEEFSKEYFKQNFFEYFLSSFFPSLILHTIWYFLVTLFGYRVDLVLISHLFYVEDYPKDVYLNINSNVWQIVAYNSTLLIVSVFMGIISKSIVRIFRLDLRYKLFRFQNSWHYVFSGEFFDFPKSSISLDKDSIDDIEFVYVDALVDSNDGTLIYEGILVDYELSKLGGLNYIILQGVQRRFLKDDGENEDEKYEIPGHNMVLPFEQILNLNFNFMKLVEIDDDTFDVQEVE